MPSLRDPITVSGTIKKTSTDEDGESIMILRIPLKDAVNAAQLSIMGKIIFAIRFTPDDVENQAARI